jgi:hypothetical protein
MTGRSNDARRDDVYSSKDPRMIAWLLLIVSAPFSRVMLYAATVYGLAYVVVPGTRAAWRARRDGPPMR